jgi:hypothetical protein
MAFKAGNKSAGAGAGSKKMGGPGKKPSPFMAKGKKGNPFAAKGKAPMKPDMDMDGYSRGGKVKGKC